MCTRPDTGHGTGQQVEVADIFRTHGAAYQQRHRLSGGQRRVMQDIIACRTAALGGQLAQCDHCGAQVMPLSLVPKPALSQMPDAGESALGGSASP